MFEIKNNEKNKSAVILNPERSEWVSRSHVTSVESVVNDGAKTKRYSAKRDLYGDFAYAQPLKMTVLAFLLSLNLSESWADNCTCSWGGADNKTLTITDCRDNGELNLSSCGDQRSANNIVVGTGVTSIGIMAFHNFSNLTSITIPEGVTTIGNEAFNGASGLKSITIPDSVTSIGDSAFKGATSLTSINFGDNSKLTSIGVAAFSGSGLTSITIPDSVTSIKWNVFWGASSLTSITIPDNINTANWNDHVFYNTPEGANIVCQGGLNTCYEKLAKYFTSETCPQSLKDAGKGNLCNCSKGCIDSSRISEASNTSQSSGAGDSEVVSGNFNPADCYNNGQVPYNNQCLDEYPFAKKRWTPAEANEWLHDGNDNFVIITFKK